MKDPIVESLHAIREQHAAQFGYDAKKIYEDIKAHECESAAQGFTFVTLSPKPVQHSKLAA